MTLNNFGWPWTDTEGHCRPIRISVIFIFIRRKLVAIVVWPRKSSEQTLSFTGTDLGFQIGGRRINCKFVFLSLSFSCLPLSIPSLVSFVLFLFLHTFPQFSSLQLYSLFPPLFPLPSPGALPQFSYRGPGRTLWAPPSGEGAAGPTNGLWYILS